MAVAQFRGVVLLSLMLKLRKWATWLWRFLPTPGSRWIGLMLAFLRTSGSPTPLCWRIWGDATAPALKIYTNPYLVYFYNYLRIRNPLLGIQNLFRCDPMMWLESRNSFRSSVHVLGGIAMLRFVVPKISSYLKTISLFANMVSVPPKLLTTSTA